MVLCRSSTSAFIRRKAARASEATVPPEAEAGTTGGAGIAEDFNGQETKHQKNVHAFYRIFVYTVRHPPLLMQRCFENATSWAKNNLPLTTTLHRCFTWISTRKRGVCQEGNVPIIIQSSKPSKRRRRSFLAKKFLQRKQEVCPWKRGVQKEYVRLLWRGFCIFKEISFRIQGNVARRSI